MKAASFGSPALTSWVQQNEDFETKLTQHCFGIKLNGTNLDLVYTNFACSTTLMTNCKIFSSPVVSELMP